MDVKLRLSLLIVILRVYSTLHLSYLGLLLYSGMCLFLSPSLCKRSLYSPNLRTIEGLLKFHPPHQQIIIRIISTRGLKVCLSSQVNANILEHFGEEEAIREYMCCVLTT